MKSAKTNLLLSSRDFSFLENEKRKTKNEKRKLHLPAPFTGHLALSVLSTILFPTYRRYSADRPHI